MKKLILAAGYMAATVVFTITATCKRRKRSCAMTFREFYEDNDVELELLLND